VYFFGDGDDQAKVGFDQLFFGLLGFGFASKNHLKRALKFGGADFAGDFDFGQLLAASLQIFASFGLHVRLGRFNAALKLAHFAFEGVLSLDGMVVFVDVALFFRAD